MKQSRFLYVFIGLLAALCCLSCDYGFVKVLDHGDDVSEREGSLLDLAAADTPKPSGPRYSFVVVTDVHFGNPSISRNDDKLFARLKELNASTYTDAPFAFCVCLGDVADHGWKGEFEDYMNKFVKEMEGIVGGRVYTAVGNHDLYNEGWDYYEDIVWPYTSFYRFKINNFSYYFTDTGSGSMGTKQFKKLKSAMEGDGNYKILCSHYPIYATEEFFWNYYTMQNAMETDSLITLCNKEKVVLSLAGHMHSDHSESENILGFKEHVVAAELANSTFMVVTVDETKHSTTEKTYTF